MIGSLKVTIEYTLPIRNLVELAEGYESCTVDDAAKTLTKWYHDGTCDIVLDYLSAESSSFSIEAMEE